VDQYVFYINITICRNRFFLNQSVNKQSPFTYYSKSLGDLLAF
jgi:hypothetical protein